MSLVGGVGVIENEWGKSRERRQCLHRDMIGYGYDWLCSAAIGSCNKSSRISLNEQYNYVRKKEVNNSHTHNHFVTSK